MNVLFVLYHDFTANSAYHVHSLAKELTDLGCSCAVASPRNKESAATIASDLPYAVFDFEDLRKHWTHFPDGRGPDIVHAWTPREVVRSFIDEIREARAFRLVVHLEDNERHITEKSLSQPWQRLALLPLDDLDQLIPAHLSHPIRAEQMLARADGVSVILDRLRELAPDGVPTVDFPASADEDLFFPRVRDTFKRQQLGIGDDEIALAYTGNVHASNAAEVRSVYLAVAMLNREGHPVKLIRTGRDFVDFLGSHDSWARANSIELGFVDREEMPRVLAAADLCVQPGAPGPFNDFRFPSKVPEFLAVGRPVILPATNIGLRMRHRENAWVLPRVDACAIFDAVVELKNDRALLERIGVAGSHFFREQLRWRIAGGRVLEFYRSIAG